MSTDNISLWRKRIIDKEASGLCLADWCTQNQLTRSSFYYWKARIRTLDTDKASEPLFVEIPSDSSDVIAPVSDSMIIKWKDVSIHVTDTHSVNLAAELLARLQTLC